MAELNLKFDPNYKQWKIDYETKLVYTQKQVHQLLEDQSRALKVNRVVRSYTGLYGPDDCVAMKILAIHETAEGLLIVVK
jgi:hypothetical protein